MAHTEIPDHCWRPKYKNDGRKWLISAETNLFTNASAMKEQFRHPSIYKSDRQSTGNNFARRIYASYLHIIWSHVKEYRYLLLHEYSLQRNAENYSETNWLRKLLKKLHVKKQSRILSLIIALHMMKNFVYPALELTIMFLNTVRFVYDTDITFCIAFNIVLYHKNWLIQMFYTINTHEFQYQTNRGRVMNVLVYISCNIIVFLP